MKQVIVDSHVHFWDPNQLQYHWLASEPAINNAFLPAQLAQQSNGMQPDKIIFVQAECLPQQALQEVARTEPQIQGIVAFAPLEQGATVVTHLQALARHPLVKGIRRLIQSEAVGFCIQPDFVNGVQVLAGFGYSFDICIFHHQLGDVLHLVDQCPDVPFVLDHIGKPDIKAGLLEPWQTQIKMLASFPNVCCKVSGMVTEADWQCWQPADFRPYLDIIFEAFGPNRLMFGSDWPVCTLAANYTQVAQLVLDYATAWPEMEQSKILGKNAINFYHLQE